MTDFSQQNQNNTYFLINIVAFLPFIDRNLLKICSWKFLLICRKYFDIHQKKETGTFIANVSDIASANVY